MLMIEERGLSGGGQQPLPVLLVGPEAVLIGVDHLLDGDHGDPILEMSDGEVGVPAHQSLDAAEGYLAE